MREYEIVFVAKLRTLSLDELVSEWTSATLFPASEFEMRVIIAEFRSREVSMTPVVADYQRRLVEEGRPAWEICHGEGGTWLPLDVDDFANANADDPVVSEAVVRAMQPGGVIRYGGGATPLVIVRRVR